MRLLAYAFFALWCAALLVACVGPLIEWAMRCRHRRETLFTATTLRYRCLDCGHERHIGTVWFGASNQKARR